MRKEGRPLPLLIFEISVGSVQRPGDWVDLHWGGMELAWAGCDDDEIASYSGHTSKLMIVKYAADARQIMRARQAAAKRR